MPATSSISGASAAIVYVAEVTIELVVLAGTTPRSTFGIQFSRLKKLPKNRDVDDHPHSDRTQKKHFIFSPDVEKRLESEYDHTRFLLRPYAVQKRLFAPQIAIPITHAKKKENRKAPKKNPTELLKDMNEAAEHHDGEHRDQYE